MKTYTTEAAPAASTARITRKLEKMQGRLFIHNCFHKRITGFEVDDKQVKIHTSMRPVVLPLKGVTARIEREFLPLSR